MKNIRIEMPSDMPLVALQGFLREHNLKLTMIGGSDKHRDYRAERAPTVQPAGGDAVPAELYEMPAPNFVLDDVERH